MSKGDNDGKFLKIQTCALKVDNICCDGCQKKVKKVLHKIDGVYTTTIDAEAKRVTVTGNVDPEILIEKLNKAGKHAELWSAKGWKEQNLPDKLQKLHLELSKLQQKGSGKAQKGGDGGGGGGKQQKTPQPQQQAKGFKDLKLPSLKDFKNPFKKNTKTAKSNHPAMELEDDDGSDFDDELDEYEDEDEVFDEMDESEEEDFDDDPKMMKAMNLQPNDNELIKDKKGGGGGGGGKGGEAQVQNKVADGKRGGGGGGSKDGGGGGGGGSKNGHGGHDSKNGGGNHNKGGNGSAHNGNPSHGGKKGGGSYDDVKKGAPMGQPNMMGQLGNMHPSMGAAGPPPGYFPGGPVPPEMMAAGGVNPYQQQYLQALMQQQQQRMMMNGQDRPGYPPMMGYGYGYGQPVYMPPPPPPGPGPYGMFSDENPNSCSIM